MRRCGAWPALGVALRARQTWLPATPLFMAIPSRQSTRGDDDGKALASEELALLQRAGRLQAIRTFRHGSVMRRFAGA